MTILEKYEERVYNGTDSDMKTRHLYLAYIMMHMQNPAIHPDDYQTVDGGYSGYQVLLAHQILHGNSKIPDNVRYPTAFLRAKVTLETFESFHADDEEPEYYAMVHDIQNFFEEMKPSELDGIVDSLQKLYLFHSTTEDDNEYICDLRDMADTLNWIMQQA